MSRHRSRAVVTVSLCSVLLTGCFVDDVPDAQQARSYSDGVTADSGPIRVVHALVVAGEGGDEGVVNMTIVNRGDQPERLSAIETDAGTVELPAPQQLPPGIRVHFGVGPDATPVMVRGLKKRPGESLSLVLRFDEVEPIRMRTVIVPADGEYATITPSPVQSPEPTESPTAEATESPTADETASPTASPS